MKMKGAHTVYARINTVLKSVIQVCIFTIHMDFGTGPGLLKPVGKLISGLFSLESLIQPRFNLSPKAHNFHITKWNDLAGNHTTESFLAITPPEQIW